VLFVLASKAAAGRKKKSGSLKKKKIRDEHVLYNWVVARWCVLPFVQTRATRAGLCLVLYILPLLNCVCFSSSVNKYTHTQDQLIFFCLSSQNKNIPNYIASSYFLRRERSDVVAWTTLTAV
jgi:hypothetical protein